MLQLKNIFDNLIVVGASRGIGAAVCEHLVSRTNRLISVSRSASPFGEWVKADISTKKGIEIVSNAYGNCVLDGLLYMGGTWENNAFTQEYSFDKCSDEDIENVLLVNLLAPIRLTKSLLPNLRKSSNPKIIFMGALSGLDNFPAREVANSASKFGLRGVVHALREELRQDRIAVTIINPGNIGTPEVLSDLREAGESEGNAIPLQDLLRVIDCVLSLSRSTCIKEIQIPAMSAKGA
ncbi:SDR family oxidoreductase [Rivularia sp. UHCC 0363]|uniref:SDR family oxidoreductase n=1 Tax=Rivularia sp. UHCC 0363 TaxID=3110244 RepID=UPI002B1FF42C|nr:SDR family oxidoreductase [Rivularia sp. UHCC 0363]MEA5594360.1 SDR family oxidoreductase [Rivularia sp. UHCC 0363]